MGRRRSGSARLCGGVRGSRRVLHHDRRLRAIRDRERLWPAPALPWSWAASRWKTCDGKSCGTPCACRIRFSEFLRAEIPCSISKEIRRALAEHAGERAVAVRSQCPENICKKCPSRGCTESVVGPQGGSAVLDAVRTVWSSLWSDAAPLYRHELVLDPQRSRMAVLVQEVRVADCSGVAFGRDPRNLQADCVVVEAVPGHALCWSTARSTRIAGLCGGPPANSSSGGRGTAGRRLRHRCSNIRTWRPCWMRFNVWRTSSRGPPTSSGRDGRRRWFFCRRGRLRRHSRTVQDQRTWYLSLRPGMRRLTELAKRVTEDLIPQLESQGASFAEEELQHYDDARLAAAILERFESLQRWKDVYHDEFIPFAHGPASLAVTTTTQCDRTIRTSSSGCSSRKTCSPRGETEPWLASLRSCAEPATQECPL